MGRAGAECGAKVGEEKVERLASGEPGNPPTPPPPPPCSQLGGRCAGDTDRGDSVGGAASCGAGPEKDIEMLARDRVCPWPIFFKLIELRDMRDLLALRACPGLAAPPMPDAATSESPPMAARRPLLDWLRRCACLAAKSAAEVTEPDRPERRRAALVGEGLDVVIDASE